MPEQDGLLRATICKNGNDRLLKRWFPPSGVGVPVKEHSEC